MPRINVSGVGLYYESRGSGEPIVFIHGLGSYTGDWQAQVDALSDRFRVVTVDLRGHGQSDKPAGPYSVPMFASDLAGLIRALDLGPAHIVGLSLGGAVAFQFAVDSPSLVRTLTIVNSGPSFVVSWKIRLALFIRIFMLKVFGLKKLGETIAARLFPKPEQEAMRRAFVEHLATNDPRAYEASTRAVAGWTVEDKLGAITCPVLVISGDRDYTPVSMKEAYVRKLPDARLEVMADAGHACSIERPEAFNALIRRFVEQPLSSSRAIPGAIGR